MPLSVLLADTPELFLEIHKELFITPFYYSCITEVLLIRSFLFQPYIIFYHSGYLSVWEGGYYILLGTESTLRVPFSPYETRTLVLTYLSSLRNHASSFHISTDTLL